MEQIFEDHLELPYCGNRPYTAVQNGDDYTALFTTVVTLINRFRRHGTLFINVKPADIVTLYESTNRLLSVAINFFCQGICSSVFYFVINLEFQRLISMAVDDREVVELTLAQALIHCWMEDKTDDIYSLLSYVSQDLRNKLAPHASILTD